MSTCSPVAVTAECRSSACGVTAVMPVLPAVSRSTVLGGSRSACTSAHKRSLHEVDARPYGGATQQTRRRRCPTPDAAMPRHRGDAGSAPMTTETHYPSTLSNASCSTHRGQRDGSPQEPSPENRRKASLALPISPVTLLNGGDACDSASTESASMSVEALPTLSPTKVAAASDQMTVGPGATSSLTSVEESSASQRASYFPRRLSCALRCSRGCSSDIDMSTLALSKSPTLYATEEEPPVTIDPEGVRCCPLIDPQSEEKAKGCWMPGDISDEQINLSPFLNWKFVPYLSPQAEGKALPTLVLDMDETLLHTSVEPMPDADAEIDVPCSSDESKGTGSSITSSRNKLFIKYRPHLGHFLRFCLDHFEVVIFTASKAFYARAVLGQLQKDYPFVAIRLAEESIDVSEESEKRLGGQEHVIKLLHRDHCTPTNVGYTKDLHLIGRDLRRTILVDNNKVCSVFQPYNSVQVKDFARRRYSEQVPDRRTRAAQLRQLKGSLPSATMSAADDAVAFTPLNDSECSTSTLDWEDSEDTVLLRLCSPGGLLRRLSNCESVPSFMRQTVRFNHDASR